MTWLARNCWYSPRFPVQRLTTLAVHMEKEGCPANDRRHYRLDAGKTLRECLEGKRVVEFPRLHVTVLPEDEGKFREPDA